MSLLSSISVDMMDCQGKKKAWVAQVKSLVKPLLREESDMLPFPMSAFFNSRCVSEGVRFWGKVRLSGSRFDKMIVQRLPNAISIPRFYGLTSTAVIVDYTHTPGDRYLIQFTTISFNDLCLEDVLRLCQWLVRKEYL